MSENKCMDYHAPGNENAKTFASGATLSECSLSLKHFLLLIILLLANCTGKETVHTGIGTENESQLIMLSANNIQEESDKIERLAEPLILGGRPYVNTRGKAYRKDEAYLFEFLGCNFSSDAIIRWHSLEGIEQLFNLKEIQIYGENLETVDLTPLLSLSNLEDLYIRGNITRLPDLIGLENLRSITVRESQLESLEGIGAPNVRRIEIKTENSLDSLAPLNNLLYLEYLNITSSGEKTYRIADMANLPNLKFLALQRI